MAVIRSNQTRVFVRIVLAMLGVSLLFAGLILGLFYATIPIHNISIWRMERSVASSITHPLDSRVLERHSFFGSRYTDTSECTYVVGEFRSTLLSREELLAEYRNIMLNLFGFAYKIPVRIIIADNNISLPLDEPADDWIYDFVQRVDTSQSDITYYLVYLYEPGRLWWGDYRCFE